MNYKKEGKIENTINYIEDNLINKVKNEIYNIICRYSKIMIHEVFMPKL